MITDKIRLEKDRWVYACWGLTLRTHWDIVVCCVGAHLGGMRPAGCWLPPLPRRLLCCCLFWPFFLTHHSWPIQLQPQDILLRHDHTAPPATSNPPASTILASSPAVSSWRQLLGFPILFKEPQRYKNKKKKEEKRKIEAKVKLICSHWVTTTPNKKINIK